MSKTLKKLIAVQGSRSVLFYKNMYYVIFDNIIILTTTDIQTAMLTLASKRLAEILIEGYKLE